jgi:hypothetical protein
LSREEYIQRREEFAPRGQDLPQAKMIDLDILSIRSAARQRKNLIKHIKDNLSNEALAKQFGVHVSTIEKILSYETWGHVP